MTKTRLNEQMTLNYLSWEFYAGYCIFSKLKLGFYFFLFWIISLMVVGTVHTGAQQFATSRWARRPTQPLKNKWADSGPWQAGLQSPACGQNRPNAFLGSMGIFGSNKSNRVESFFKIIYKIYSIKYKKYFFFIYI